MAGYCADTDIINRLSTDAVLYLCNDDNSGTYDSATQAYVNQFIEDCSSEIDICLQASFNVPRALIGNTFLLRICVDLVCERMFERKGQMCPESMKDAAVRAKTYLDLIRDRRLRLPNVTYPGDGFVVQNRQKGLPRVANPVVGSSRTWRPLY